MRSPAAVWSHDGRRIYVGGWGLGVLVVDAERGLVVDSIRTGNHPSDVFLHPSADRVYVTNAQNSSLTVIRDEICNAEHPGLNAATGSLTTPTIARGSLVLHGTRPSVVFDASGRRAMELSPGANDVSRLAPGVYFCRLTAGFASSAEPLADGYQPSDVAKVIISK